MGKALRINSTKRETFLDTVRQELPKGGNLNLCLPCAPYMPADQMKMGQHLL